MDGDFRLASWLVRPSLNSVSRNGTTVHLEPKVMQVLVTLAEHPGEVVTKEQLIHRVWAETFVTDDVLTRSISELRKAFEDNAREPTYIQTIPKRGYRLVAPVTPVNGTSGRSSVASLEAEPVRGGVRWRSRAGKLGALALVGIVLLCSLLFALNVGNLRDRMLGQSDVPVIHSLAVLPLKNLSGDPTQEYFADAMTEELITELSRISALRVISRTSIMRYKKTDRPLPEIARELGVDGIVEGSVLRSGDRVRVTVQFIYAPKDTNLWAETYDRNLRDTLTLQSEVAAAIAGEIQTQLTPEEKTRLKTPRPVDLKALDAYLQGIYHLNKKGRGSGDEEKAHAATYFQDAITEDPGFAAAYIALARTHEALLLPSIEDHDAMKIALEKAVSLDPSSAEIRTLLGVVECDEWNWSRAEKEYRRGIELNPNSVDGHLYLAWFLHGTGRLSEAVEEYQRAQELDPSEDHLSDSLAAQGKYDSAIGLKRRALESHPDDGYLHYQISQMYALKGDYKGWVQEQEHSVTLFGSPELAASLDDAFAKEGYRGAMRVLAADLERFQVQRKIYMPLTLAEVYTALGNEERAFYWLEDAYNHYRHGYSDSADGGMMWLKGDPWFAPLRSDHRFKDLVRRVSLPQ